MATAAAAAAERALPADFHATSKIENVKVEDLKVDRSYQRELSIPLVETIKNNWDEVASELVLVSRREDGSLHIINGQHRTAAARLLNLKKIPARVIDGLTVEQEAALRLKTNVRLTDRPLERFRAQVAAGDEQSIAIVNILEKFDTQVNLTPSQEEGINAISTVETLYEWDDGYTLKEALTYLRATYGRVGGKYATATLIQGTAWFLSKHEEEANIERLSELQKGLGIGALNQRARVMQSTLGGTLWLNLYRALVDLYNEQLTDKNKLEWRTRGSARLASRKRAGTVSSSMMEHS